MINLSVILEDSTRKHRRNPAFTCEEISYTFQQINDEANKVANGLKAMGMLPGDKVALNCLNLPQFPIIYFGILKAAGVVVPLSVQLKKDEITYQLKDSDAKFFFCFEGTADLPMGQYGWSAFDETPTCEHFFMIMPRHGMKSKIESAKTLDDLTSRCSDVFETIQTSGEDTAVIIYTSGTTGLPKGAELTHSNLLLNAMLCADSVLNLKPKDVQLIALPLFHIFAMTLQMNASILQGAHCLLLTRFDPSAVLVLLSRYKVSVFAGVPTMYWALLNFTKDEPGHERRAHQLRRCISGGASLPVKILKDFEASFGVPILEGYGMSEGSPVVTFNHQQIGRKAGSVGTAVWGVEVKIVGRDGNEVATGEKGELWYRGHNVMKRYYKKDKETAEVITNGWLHSGDIAVKDIDGFFFIIDRIKDTIIRGGKNVYPREVEDVMMKHEAVSLVAVVGVPCEKMGEEIKAFVVLQKDRSATKEEIILWTKDKIAAYKYPRYVEFVDSLPINASGKILKKNLRIQPL
ncbi:long-chain acyl-CoA synthetase [Algoriphagus sp. 4150]|uniref:long-chain-fatty-acid--CoA ligase n=1 Tax=Algoriphagus sp. 4150 TaxID=2817756 RepID=UPI002862B4E4|nr:long-chain fatty acid--CoA ligase [Algoriphagus sp. 4150]MDR7128328.1 long-chain acyl-CoA synthetase [Algoriphagus sp. 4150]